jgi:excisionase family DNA binding protein
VSTPGNDPGVKEVREPCDYPLIPSTEGRPLNLLEAARYLNVSERYVRRLVAERRVPFLKVGRLLRFRPSDLEEYLVACQVRAAVPHPLLRNRRS